MVMTRAKTLWEGGPEGHSTLRLAAMLAQLYQVTATGTCECGAELQGFAEQSDGNARRNMYRRWLKHHEEMGELDRAMASEKTGKPAQR